MLQVGLVIFFSIGYLAIIFENFLHVNKTAVALIMGVVCWSLFFFTDHGIAVDVLTQHLSDVAEIIFFLFAAMIIVELIDSHHGFKLITDILYSSSKRKML